MGDILTRSGTWWMGDIFTRSGTQVDGGHFY